MLSPYTITPSTKTNQRKQKTTNMNLDNVKVTSNDLKMTSKESVKNKENKFKGGTVETNENYLDEFCQNNYLQMHLAIQKIANDKTVRSDTVHILKDFNNQCLATQAEKR